MLQLKCYYFCILCLQRVGTGEFKRCISLLTRHVLSSGNACYVNTLNGNRAKSRLQCERLRGELTLNSSSKRNRVPLLGFANYFWAYWQLGTNNNTEKADERYDAEAFYNKTLVRTSHTV